MGLTRSQLDDILKANATASVDMIKGAQTRDHSQKLATEGHDRDEALRKFLQVGDLENNRLIAGSKLSEDSRHNRAMERIGSQQANTVEGYRTDQGDKMKEDARRDKLKILLTGGTGDPKVSGEQQKVLNLADNARQGLNQTEELLQKHPIAGTAQTALQSIPLIGDAVSNGIAGIAGGPFKAIRDSKANTKEAMQNLYTGAAASGEQVPAFQGFAGPGALDVLTGNVNTSGGTRDAINTFQQRQKKAMPRLNNEMLQAAEMADDPIAQQALKQQEDAIAAAKQAQLSKMRPQDRLIYDEIQANPQHPNAQKAYRDLVRRYGNLD